MNMNQFNSQIIEITFVILAIMLIVLVLKFVKKLNSAEKEEKKISKNYNQETTEERAQISHKSQEKSDQPKVSKENIIDLSDLKSKPIPQKRKYAGPKYSRISNRDIKAYTGKSVKQLDNKSLQKAIDYLAKSNREKEISPYSVYISTSMANLGKTIGFKSSGPVNSYFNNGSISLKAKKKIENFIKSNIVNKRLILEN